MGWFSKKNGNGSNGASKEKTLLRGTSAGTEEIPGMIIDRLKNANEGMVLVGVRALRTNTKYPANDVCEHLIRLLQRDGREEIMREASEALAEVLKRVHGEETAVLMIKQGLFAKNESNAGTFIKILESTAIRIGIRKCAIELLAKFNEKDVAPETMDRMEAALFERCMDPQEQDCIKNLVKNRFGPSRDGRPKITSEETRVDGSGREDETIVIGEAGSTAAIPEKNAYEAPTKGMDILAGWIGLLQHPDKKRRDIAAESLLRMAEKSNDKDTVATIATALYGCGSEFPEQHRKVLNRLDNMPLVDIRNTPTMPPMRPSSGTGNGNKNGSGPVKLRR